MTKKELQEELERLRERVDDLEMRPVSYPLIIIQPATHPQPSIPWGQPPFICESGNDLTLRTVWQTRSAPYFGAPFDEVPRS